MPRYEYRCRSCGDTFELSRPMAESSDPAACPAGHEDTVKLLTPAVEPAKGALTIGVTTVLAAGSILVIASGPGKTEALDNLRNGPEDPAWPVTWLRRHPRLSLAIGPQT